MVSELVVKLTVVLCVTPIVFTVDEWKSLHNLFICIGAAVHG